MKSEKINEFNPKIIIKFLKRYAVIIIITVSVFTIYASFSAYTKMPVYSTSTKIELKKLDGAGSDILTQAFRGESFDNVTEIIKSSLMTMKVLDKLQLGTRYYYAKNLKEIELYKSAPFVVETMKMNENMYAKKIYIVPIDEVSFKLEVRKKSDFSMSGLKSIMLSSKHNGFEYSKIHKYEEDITTAMFNVKISKIHNAEKNEYYFTYVPNSYMGNMISSGLSAAFLGRGSSILQIDYVDSVALRAKEVLVQVAVTFLNDQVERKNLKTARSLEFLDRELDELNKNIQSSSDKLKKFKQSHNIVSNVSSTQEVVVKIQSDKNKIRDLETQKSILESLQEYINSGKNLIGISLNAEQIVDSLLTTKVERLQTLSEERRRLLGSYTEFHPDVIKVSDEIDIVEDNIKFILQNNIQKIINEIRLSKKDINEATRTLSELPQNERKLADLNRNYSINDNIYGYLLEKRAELGMLESSGVSSARIIEPASFPYGAYRPKRLIIVLTGIIFGFMTGIGIGYIINILTTTVQDESEVESSTDLAVYAKIPYVQGNRKSVAYEESFRVLRTNLEFALSTEKSKTVVMSSAISGEGKSSVIAHLAEVIFKANKKVIVLDLDLRRPQMHVKFALADNTYGMSTLISNLSTLEQSLQYSKIGIPVIPSGKIPPNPSELLMSDNFEFLMKNLKENYEYILIDTPPYSVVTDGSIVMKNADFVLFNVLLNSTKKSSVEKLDEYIKAQKLNTVGLIISGIKQDKEVKNGYGYFTDR